MTPAQGFPPRVRVRRRADFRRAYEEGTKVVRKPLVLFARPNEQPETRLGVTATRKIGNAVVRNRAKRLVRHAFRTVRSELAAGYDLVVVVRPALLRLRSTDLIPVFREAAQAATQGAA